MPSLVQGLLATASAVLMAEYVDYKWGLTSDFSYIYRLSKIYREAAQTTRTFADVWEAAVDKHADRVFVVFEGRSLTYGQVESAANRLANWLMAEKYQQGDAVALFMENSPEFLVACIAMAKLGVKIAFINTNLRGKGFLHCLQIAGTRTLLFGSELTAAVQESHEQVVQLGIRCFVQGQPVAFAAHLDALLAHLPDTRPPRSARDGLDLHSIYSFTYTSGTTGLPKAANLPHARQLLSGYFISYMFNMAKQDRLYVTMPLYHSAAGSMAFSAVVVTGCTMILRRKFSATAFVSEIREHKVTMFQYIGELCRYLVNVPETPLDGKNNLRIAFGNGLRPDIWEKFQKRFNIPRIGELYAGTEHSVGFVGFTTDMTPTGRGSFGRLGIIMRRLHNSRILKYDVDKDELVRGPDGMCVPCAFDEPGELVGKLDDTYRFYGYHNNDADSNKKILRDVCTKGDLYYRSGDLVKMDPKGFVYFVDRIGDTFRWKGENVSTNEVMEALTTYDGVHEANVYGVQVPGKEGRAGMSAVVMDDNIDLNMLGQHVSKTLPPYAIPLFLRKLNPEQSAAQSTGTFKYQKVTLRNEGFDPTIIKEPLFIYNNLTKSYEQFGPQQYHAILAGSAKL